MLCFWHCSFILLIVKDILVELSKTDLITKMDLANQTTETSLRVPSRGIMIVL